MECMNSVVFALQAARVVYAATGYDCYVRAVGNVEVVINEVVKPRFGEDDGDIHPFAFRFRFNINVDARLVLFRHDVYVRGDVSPGEFSVFADVISPRGDRFKPGYFFEQTFFGVA